MFWDEGFGAAISPIIFVPKLTMVNLILLMKGISLQLLTVEALEINFKEMFRKMRLVSYVPPEKPFIVNVITLLLMKSALSLAFLFSEFIKGNRNVLVACYISSEKKITFSLKSSVVDRLLKWPKVISNSSFSSCFVNFIPLNVTWM